MVERARPGSPAQRRSRRFIIDGSMVGGGGAYTYLVNLVPRLAERAPRDEFLVFTRSKRIADAIPTQANLQIRLLSPADPFRRFWFNHFAGPRIAKKWGADLYYSATESVPLWAPCPVVASFQNANVFTPLRLRWSLYQRVRMRLLAAIARLSARRASRILFVSRDSARWMGDAVGLPPGKRAWLHHGADSEGWPSDAGGSTRRPYILSLSSIYRYKNYVRLIEAYAEAAGRNPDLPDLVIIGDDQDPPYSTKMEAARSSTGDLAHRIHIRGEVAYSDVPTCYRDAAMFVFPSYLETFGIPMVEAMISEVPIIASDLPVFHEIAGDAALYVDPHDTSSIAEGIESMFRSTELRKTLVERGRERVKQFTWTAAADRLISIFDSVLERA